MSNMYFLPRVFQTRSDINPFTTGDLIDRMFDVSLPWKILKTLHNDRLNEEKALLPSIDVTSDASAYTLTAEIPGVGGEDVKLEVKDGVLILSGEKKSTQVKDEEKTRYHVSERRWGSFTREMTLPEDADVNAISAQHKDGVLTITIPRKAPEKKSQTIAITKN